MSVCVCINYVGACVRVIVCLCYVTVETCSPHVFVSASHTLSSFVHLYVIVNT